MTGSVTQPLQAFFLTVKALHLGLVHMIADQREVARKIHMQSQYLRDLEAMLQGCGTLPSAALGTVFSQDVSRLHIPASACHAQ